MISVAQTRLSRVSVTGIRPQGVYAEGTISIARDLRYGTKQNNYSVSTSGLFRIHL
jgi:hypothetical protein